MYGVFPPSSNTLFLGSGICNALAWGIGDFFFHFPFFCICIYSTVTYFGGSFGVLTVHGVLFVMDWIGWLHTGLGFDRDLLLWLEKIKNITV